jgi:hypothetical protein
MANSHLMPSFFLEMAVAFVEMLRWSFGFASSAKKRRSSFKWQHFLLQWYLWVYHKTQPFLCLKNDFLFWRLFIFCYPFDYHLYKGKKAKRKKGIIIYIS